MFNNQAKYTATRTEIKTNTYVICGPYPSDLTRCYCSVRQPTHTSLDQTA